jgi:UDP-N-acetylbacillosamine N-acetyltransferase
MTRTAAGSATQLIVWGAGGHARVVAETVRLNGVHIVAFIDDTRVVAAGGTIHGAPLWDRSRFDKAGGDVPVIIAIGDCAARLRLGRELRSAGRSLFTAIHPSAVVASDAVIGDGSVLAAGSVVAAGARVGRDVIVNTGATVDHECVVEDAVHLSPGVHVGGRVTIGEQSWIGIGAIIKDRVTVGRAAVVGAGSVVLRDIPDEVTAYGRPAKVVGK